MNVFEFHYSIETNKTINKSSQSAKPFSSFSETNQEQLIFKKIIYWAIQIFVNIPPQLTQHKQTQSAQHTNIWCEYKLDSFNRSAVW